MPRPKKWRKVCSLPPYCAFAPADGKQNQKEPVTITVDEYETVRLIDHEGFTQEECSRYMDIARSTVQQIYFDARKKLAQMLAEGRPLRIGGGEYRLCDGREPACACGNCHRRRLGWTDTIKEGKNGENSNPG